MMRWGELQQHSKMALSKVMKCMNPNTKINERTQSKRYIKEQKKHTDTRCNNHSKQQTIFNQK